MQLERELKQAEFRSYSIDSWSEIKYCRKYMGMHVYFTKKTGELSGKGLFIHFLLSTESETSDYLATSALDVIQKYAGSKEGTIAVMSDRGSNVANVSTIIGVSAQFCYAHLTDNIVVTFMQSLVSLRHLRKGVGQTTSQFTRSTVANSLLETAQDDSESNVKHVKSILPGRWGIFFDSALRLIGLGHEIGTVLNQLPKGKGTLSCVDLKFLQNVLFVLQPLKDFSERVANRDHKEHLSIIEVLRGSVQLFLYVSKQSLRLLQECWQNDPSMRNPIDLDSEMDETNLQGMSAACAVILLQLLRQYLFQTMLTRLKKDPQRIELALVGASLDSQWEKTFDFAAKSSLLSQLPSSSVGQYVGTDFENDFLTAIRESHSTYIGTAPQGLSQLTSHLQTVDENEGIREETIFPLPATFKKLDLEDMCAILMNLHLQFIDDISSLRKILSCQLEKYVVTHKLRPTGDAEVPASAEKSDFSFPAWKRLSSYSSFSSSSEMNPPSFANPLPNADSLIAEHVPSQWDKLRSISHSRPPSHWKSLSPSENDTMRWLLRQLHRSLDTVRSATDGLERNFSDATSHQVPDQSNLSPWKFGMEVQISRNYSLLGHEKWSQEFSWRDRLPEAVAGKMAEFYADPEKYYSKTGIDKLPSISPLSKSTDSMSPIIFSPAPSRAPSRLTAPITCSTPLRERSFSVPPSSTGQQVHRIAVSDSVLADAFLHSVHQDGANFLTNKQSRAGKNDGQDSEDIAVRNVQQHAKKRKTPSSDIEHTADLSQSRQAIIPHLKDTLNGNKWTILLNDQACKLSTVKKKLQKIFNFAVNRALLGEMTVKFRSLVTSDSDYVQGLQHWMESKVKEHEDISIPVLIDLTLPPQAGSALVGFSKLLRTEIIAPPASLEEATAAALRAIFRQNLSDAGLEQQDCGGGGNCFFSSTAYCLQKATAQEKAQLANLGMDNLTHLSIRRIAVNVIRGNWEAYEPFRTNTSGIGEAEESHVWLEQMEKSGRWADHLVIKALSDYFGIEFHIFRDDGSIIHVLAENGQQTTSISLVLLGEYHYMATKPKLARRR